MLKDLYWRRLKMENKIIVCDIDDVLRDFNGKVLEIYNKENHTHYTMQDIKEFDNTKNLPLIKDFKHWLFNHHKVLTQGRPIQYNINALNELYKTNTIVLATNQFEMTEDLTAQWIGEHRVPYHALFFGKDKWLLKGDMIIDDKVSNVQKFVYHNPGSIGYLIDQPWNRIVTTPYKNTDLNIVRIQSIEDIL